MSIRCSWMALVASLLVVATSQVAEADGFERLNYRQQDLTVDLGVGLWAWPLPMDYDGDGDHDLLVSCPDKPFNGVYFFENIEGNTKLPTFRPPVRLGRGYGNIQPSYIGGKVRLLTPGKELAGFMDRQFENLTTIYPKSSVHPVKVRANQWRLADYDGDAKLDLIVGVGDWTEYGWDNAYDSTGKWTNGPLHGYVYVLINRGTNDKPKYDEPKKVEAAGRPVDVYGEPTPNFGDFDGDGDLDLLCGEFLDRFTYFENTGTRREPRYVAGRFLHHNQRTITMDLEMIVPVAFDWDRDGDLDLIVGDEDGRVALVEHTGKVVDKLPQFLPPIYFQQQAELVKFGALATPVGVDFDGDGDDDIVSGNTAGYIGWIENLGGGDSPRWAKPRRLEVDGQSFRVLAGENGSIQGPCEAKWGYTTISVADWNHDGLLDVVYNSIWGKVEWLRNIGTRASPKFAAPQPVNVDWNSEPPKPTWVWWQPKANELCPEWRTTPVVVDWNRDGLSDLVMLDHEGYLAFYERTRGDNDLYALKPGRRAFRIEGDTTFEASHRPSGVDPQGLRLNSGLAGRSGRRKLSIVDWDGDGELDLLVNSVNVNVLKNVGTKDGVTTFRDLGPVDTQALAGHDTSPTTVDWNRDGVPDLLVGAEDGHFYYLNNPRTRK